MNEKCNKVKKNNIEDADIFSGQVGASMTINMANASNEAYSGMELLKAEAERMINVFNDKKQGNFFEIIERTKFNIDAASKNSTMRATTTAEIGRPHDPADILILDKGEVLREVQAKSSKKAASALHEMSQEKYKNMQKLFNSDKVDKAKELAQKRVDAKTLKTHEYEDTLKNGTGELNYKDISSGGTSYKEAMEATEHTKPYVKNIEIKQFSKELGKSVKSTAIASAVIGGGISIVKNSIEYTKDEISKEELVGNVAIDTSKATIKGGLIGGVSTCVRTVAVKANKSTFAKTNVSTSIATGMIDIGITVVDYIKGDIDSQEAMIQIGGKGFSSISSIYAGMYVGTIFATGGTIVGSLAGYMIASNIYQICVDTYKNAKLSEEEYIRLINLYDESIKIMKEETTFFNKYIKERFNENYVEFSKIINSIDDGIKKEDISNSFLSINYLANYLGEKLEFEKFEDFNDFMKTKDPFVLKIN